MSRLEADLALAELKLQQVAAKLEDAQIVSPFDGEVQLYPELEEGKGVPAYEAVARLVDPASYEIVASLVRDDMEYLYEGMPVIARVSGALGDTELSGVIATLPQPFGSGLGTSTIIALDDAEATAQLRAGAGIELAAELNRQEATLWLPPEAVRGFGENRFVLVEETGGSLNEVPIVVGVSNSEQVQILDGAFEGMTVVGQ